MKNIQPFDLWIGGKTVTVGNITCQINFDNLKDRAEVLYYFRDENGNMFGHGVVEIDGENYQNWFSNDDTYVIVCGKLNLSLLNTIPNDTNTTTNGTATTNDVATGG